VPVALIYQNQPRHRTRSVISGRNRFSPATFRRFIHFTRTRFRLTARSILLMNQQSIWCFPTKPKRHLSIELVRNSGENAGSMAPFAWPFVCLVAKADAARRQFARARRCHNQKNHAAKSAFCRCCRSASPNPSLAIINWKDSDAPFDFVENENGVRRSHNRWPQSALVGRRSPAAPIRRETVRSAYSLISAHKSMPSCSANFESSVLPTPAGPETEMSWPVSLRVRDRRGNLNRVHDSINRFVLSGKFFFQIRFSAAKTPFIGNNWFGGIFRHSRTVFSTIETRQSSASVCLRAEVLSPRRLPHHVNRFVVGKCRSLMYFPASSAAIFKESSEYFTPRDVLFVKPFQTF